jgi:hypothetical protein
VVFKSKFIHYMEQRPTKKRAQYLFLLLPTMKSGIPAHAGNLTIFRSGCCVSEPEPIGPSQRGFRRLSAPFSAGNGGEWSRGSRKKYVYTSESLHSKMSTRTYVHNQDIEKSRNSHLFCTPLSVILDLEQMREGFRHLLTVR